MVVITNTTIYEKLLEVEKYMINMNARVILNKWTSVTALTFVIGVVFILIKNI